MFVSCCVMLLDYKFCQSDNCGVLFRKVLTRGTDVGEKK